MRLLGGKEPRHLPLKATQVAVKATLTATRRSLWAYGNARRLEMLLLGRRQAEGWLKNNGFNPVVDPHAWRELGRSAGRHLERKDTTKA
jgi:hypothetical protein